MLDAFGKGASEDIQAAKAELYKQLTWDPTKQSFALTDTSALTPMPSPPPSPKQPPSARAASEQGAFSVPLAPLPSACAGLWLSILGPLGGFSRSNTKKPALGEV